MSSNERLRRLLFLVPYVVHHPGIEVDLLAGELGLSREELLADLELLTLVGRPPFQPDDFIDIYVENDRVYVDLDQRLKAPPRLTAPEAAALAAAASLLRPAAGDTLARALVELERVVPAASLKRYREMAHKLDTSLAGPTEVGTLLAAATERRQVSFDYLTAGRAQTERRTVQPLEVFSHKGQWYLSAFCLSRQDDRLFRVDRISALTLEEERFAPRERRPAVPPSPVGGEVTVRFSKESAPYVRERFGDQARALPDGAVEVQVIGDSERWLVQWVLSFGGDAVVVGPAWARKAVAEAARASLRS